MKKILMIFSLSVLLFSNENCKKDTGCNDKTIDSERGQILAYAAANSIIATAHSTGVYYQVTNPGSGATPTPYSQVSVRYTGKLLNGTVFDSQTGTPVSLTLGNAITGWQIGLQLIQKGGTIKLIIPSSLAYGCQGSGPIPGNSILYFDVELVDVH